MCWWDLKDACGSPALQAMLFGHFLLCVGLGSHASSEKHDYSQCFFSAFPLYMSSFCAENWIKSRIKSRIRVNIRCEDALGANCYWPASDCAVAGLRYESSCISCGPSALDFKHFFSPLSTGVTRCHIEFHTISLCLRAVITQSKQLPVTGWLQLLDTKRSLCHIMTWSRPFLWPPQSADDYVF